METGQSELEHIRRWTAVAQVTARTALLEVAGVLCNSFRNGTIAVRNGEEGMPGARAERR